MHKGGGIRGQAHGLADAVDILWLATIRAARQTDEGVQTLTRDKESRTLATMCCSCEGCGRMVLRMNLAIVTVLGR